MVSFTLNFSKSAINVIAQYYQLLRLGMKRSFFRVNQADLIPGKAGYETTMRKLYQVATQIARGIQSIADGTVFRIISRGDVRALPVVLWRLRDSTSYDGRVTGMSSS